MEVTQKTNPKRYKAEHSKSKNKTFVHSIHDEVEDAVLQHIVRKGLAIFALEVHKELKEILLGPGVSCCAAVTNDVERKVNDNLLIFGHLLANTIQTLDKLPWSLEETLTNDGIETVKGSSELDLLLR